MNTQLLYNFSVNKGDKTIHVQREFDSSLDLVWKAWTTAELLDEWWGPKPWRAETKTMDFSEGGFWHYAMVSPEGERHWSKVSYITIDKEKFFLAKDGFCDENGTMNAAFPQNLWENSFTPATDKVLVDIRLSFDTLADLEKIIEMGFQEGFAMGLQNLDELLHSLNNDSGNKR